MQQQNKEIKRGKTTAATLDWLSDSHHLKCSRIEFKVMAALLLLLSISWSSTTLDRRAALCYSQQWQDFFHISKASFAAAARHVIDVAQAWDSSRCQLFSSSIHHTAQTFSHCALDLCCKTKWKMTKNESCKQKRKKSRKSTLTLFQQEISWDTLTLLSHGSWGKLRNCYFSLLRSARTQSTTTQLTAQLSVPFDVEEERKKIKKSIIKSLPSWKIDFFLLRADDMATSHFCCSNKTRLELSHSMHEVLLAIESEREREREHETLQIIIVQNPFTLHISERCHTAEKRIRKSWKKKIYTRFCICKFQLYIRRR